MTCREAYQLWYPRSRQGRAAQRRYRASVKGRATARRYAVTCAKKRKRLAAHTRRTRKAQQARYWRSPAGKATMRRYHASAKFKLVCARYYQKVKARRARARR